MALRGSRCRHSELPQRSAREQQRSDRLHLQHRHHPRHRIDGQPWFVASDFCKVLGLTNVTQATKALDQNEVRKLNQIAFALGRGGKDIPVISESGLYKLALRSDKPDAKPFQDWVTKVVLPAIRKDGAYVMGEEKVGH